MQTHHSKQQTSEILLDLGRSCDEQQPENLHLDCIEEDSSACIDVEEEDAAEEKAGSVVVDDTVVVEDTVVDDAESMDHRMVNVDAEEDSAVHNDLLEDFQEVLRICNLDRSLVIRKLIAVE